MAPDNKDDQADEFSEQMNRAGKNFLWLLFEKGLRVVLVVATGIWVARYLGAEEFGRLSYAIALTSLFVVLADLGLGQILVRDMVRKPGQVGVYLGTSFLLRLCGACLSLVFIALAIGLLGLESPLGKYCLIIGAGHLFRPIEVVDSYYQSRTLSKYPVAARNTAVIAGSLLKVGFILTDSAPIYFVLAVLFEGVIAALMLVAIYMRTSMRVRWQVSGKAALELLGASWPLALSAFLITCYMRVDQIMIANMLDIRDVGIFSVAVSLTEFWLFVPTIIVSSVTPYLTRLRENNAIAYQQRLEQLFSFMFWLGVSAAVAVSLVGEQLIGLLYGEEYLPAFKPLVVSVWSGLFVSQALARGIWLINEDLQVYRLLNNLFSVALNVTLNLLLIPRYGIYGAAIATLLTQGLSTWVISMLWPPLRSSTISMIRAVNPKCLFYSERAV